MSNDMGSSPSAWTIRIDTTVPVRVVSFPRRWPWQKPTVTLLIGSGGREATAGVGDTVEVTASVNGSKT